jgi:hypothetical protein
LLFSHFLFGLPEFSMCLCIFNFLTTKLSSKHRD